VLLCGARVGEGRAQLRQLELGVHESALVGARRFELAGQDVVLRGQPLDVGDGLRPEPCLRTHSPTAPMASKERAGGRCVGTRGRAGRGAAKRAEDQRRAGP
jgi:hypothetical protein